MIRKFAILAATFVVSSVGHAHVPPSAFQVKTFIAKHKDVKTLRARSTLKGLGGDTSGAEIEVQTLVDYTARAIRTRFLIKDGIELGTERRELDGGSASVGAMLLFESMINPAVKSLKDAGVPIRVEAELTKLSTEAERRASEELMLKRWNGSVFWVIGRGESQLWTLKDAFLPMRLILKTPEGPSELRLEGYKYTREFPYPRKLTYLLGGVSIFEETVTEVQVNADVALLKTWGDVGLRAEGESSPEQVRALMRRYLAVLR